jgi:dipeptidase E
MAKLYLSSMNPSNKDELLKLFDDKANLSVVIIPTGWDTYPTERKETEVANILAIFKDLGFETTILELKDSPTDNVEEALEGKSLVWVMAGNTFYLNHFLHKSHFDKVIKKHMNAGLVYGGESAGAVVAGPTLKGVEQVDDMNESPEAVWEGLGLVDFGIIPHWGWEKYDAELKAAKQDMEKICTVVTVDNDHALVVNGDRQRTIPNPSGKA